MNLVVLQVSDRISSAPRPNVPQGLAHQPSQFGFRRNWIASIQKLGTSPLNKGCDSLPERLFEIHYELISVERRLRLLRRAE